MNVNKDVLKIFHGQSKTLEARQVWHVPIAHAAIAFVLNCTPKVGQIRRPGSGACIGHCIPIKAGSTDMYLIADC